MKSIRNSVKALIIEDSKLLAIKLERESVFYTLPGGGQERGESLVEALARECYEELGCEVMIGDLVYVRDYIAKNHEFAHRDPEFHQVEFMFRCSLSAGASPSMTENKDTYQTGIEWLPLKDLADYAIYPKVFQSILRKQDSPCYMGDVN